MWWKSMEISWEEREREREGESCLAMACVDILIKFPGIVSLSSWDLIALDEAQSKSFSQVE